jgi:hypothetical protein
MKKLIVYVLVLVSLYLRLGADTDCDKQYKKREESCNADHRQRVGRLIDIQSRKIQEVYVTLFNIELPASQSTSDRDLKKCQSELENKLAKAAGEAAAEVIVASALYNSAAAGCLATGPGIVACEAAAWALFSKARVAIAARAAQQIAFAYLDNNTCTETANTDAYNRNSVAEKKYNLGRISATNEFNINVKISEDQHFNCLMEAEKIRRNCAQWMLAR